MKTAILAGMGNFPMIAAEKLRERNIDTIAIVANDTIASNMEGHVGKVYVIELGKIGKTLKVLKQEKITHVLMIGKYDKTVLEGRLKPDLRAIWMLARLKNRSHDTIHYAIVDLLKKRGIETMSQADVLSDIIPGLGVFTKNKPDKELLADVAFGYTAATAISRLDIGQTVVVKKKNVLAVESAEGTDATIARGCQIASEGAVVVKAAKVAQDVRFDLPAIGMSTFKAVVENKGRLLAVEADKTLVVDLENCIKYADEHGLIFMTFDPAKVYDEKLFGL